MIGTRLLVWTHQLWCTNEEKWHEITKIRRVVTNTGNFADTDDLLVTKGEITLIRGVRLATVAYA